MTLLHIIDTLCDVTTKQADLLRELVTDLEHMNQVSEEVKNYYREKLDSIDQEMNVAEYGCRELPYMDEAHREGKNRCIGYFRCAFLIGGRSCKKRSGKPWM